MDRIVFVVADVYASLGIGFKSVSGPAFLAKIFDGFLGVCFRHIGVG